MKVQILGTGCARCRRSAGRVPAPEEIREMLLEEGSNKMTEPLPGPVFEAMAQENK